jgi:aryl-alcohol dehydrogenase-like predicted oxidoreductase
VNTSADTQPADHLRQLGSSGMSITAVGLGAWAIGGPWQKGWGAQDDAESVATIHYALEAGVSWIDTAAVYGLGHAEEVIADALADLPESERPLVLTKCGRFEDGGATGKIGSPEAIRRGCEESLERLRVERLDCLQLHWPPEDGTPLELTWETMAALKGEGKVASIGASNCTVDQLDSIAAIAPVEVVQPPLSLINRSALDEIVPWAERNGAGVIVYSPMQSGILTGGFHDRVATLADDDWRRENPEFGPPRLARNLDLVERLRPIADSLGASIAELAIAWVLSRRGVTAAIVGARKPGQVDGWIGAAGLSLGPEVAAEIAAAVEASGAGQGSLGHGLSDDSGDLVRQ